MTTKNKNNGILEKEIEKLKKISIRDYNVLKSQKGNHSPKEQNISKKNVNLLKSAPEDTKNYDEELKKKYDECSKLNILVENLFGEIKNYEKKIEELKKVIEGFWKEFNKKLDNQSQNFQKKIEELFGYIQSKFNMKEERVTLTLEEFEKLKEIFGEDLK